MFSFLRFRWKLWIVILGIPYYLIFLTIEPPKAFQISPETTYFTSPLTPSGRVDYGQALNLRYGPVSPADNVVIPLLRLYSPASLPIGTEAAAIASLLGTPFPLPADLSYRPLDEFLASSAVSTPEVVSGTRDAASAAFLAASLTPRPIDAEFPQPPVDIGKVRLKECGCKPWKASEYPDVDSWINANQQSFALLADASQRKRFWWPFLQGDSGDDLLAGKLFGRSHYVQAHRGLLARSMRRLGTGDTDGSLSDLQIALRLSRHVTETDFLVDKLLGLLTLDETLKTCEAWITIASLSPKLCDQLADSLSVLRPIPSMNNALETEHLWQFVLLYNQAYDKNHAVQQYVDFNQLARRFLQLKASHSKILSDPDLKRKLETLTVWSTQPNSFDWLDDKNQLIWRIVKVILFTTRWTKVSAITDLYGDVVLSIAVPNYSELIRHSLTVAVRLDLVHLAALLKKAQITTGTFPPRLEMILPDAASIPIDPFSGKPLIYRYENNGCLMYSYGHNFADDGAASDTSATTRSDDIVVRLAP
ncbi:MAG TPA: hypothetical protein PKO06_16330 [Candidatus Ozemobacteraceae bacterium]|nr:hypothetical protein [Candidatus Ozemobacteraceae bacterium]